MMTLMRAREEKMRKIEGEIRRRVLPSRNKGGIDL